MVHRDVVQSKMGKVTTSDGLGSKTLSQLPLVLETDIQSASKQRNKQSKSNKVPFFSKRGQTIQSLLSKDPPRVDPAPTAAHHSSHTPVSYTHLTLPTMAVV